MTTVRNQPIVATAARPAPSLPRVSAESNDMSQRTAKTGPNAFSITGTASNRGMAPSELTVKVNGKTIHVPQSGGETPAQVAKKLSAALPRGFKAEITAGPAANSPVTVQITDASSRSRPAVTGRLMSPTAFAQENLAAGKEIKTLVAGGRGWGNGKDLIKNPTELAKYKVGEFEGAATRSGHHMNNVYKIRVAGPDDKPIDRIVVRVPVTQPNDTLKYKFVDVGHLSPGGPNN